MNRVRLLLDLLRALLVYRSGICLAARSTQSLTVPEQIHSEPNCIMPPLCGSRSRVTPDWEATAQAIVYALRAGTRRKFNTNKRGKTNELV